MTNGKVYVAGGEVGEVGVEEGIDSNEESKVVPYSPDMVEDESVSEKRVTGRKESKRSVGERSDVGGYSVQRDAFSTARGGGDVRRAGEREESSAVVEVGEKGRRGRGEGEGGGGYEGEAPAEYGRGRKRVQVSKEGEEDKTSPTVSYAHTKQGRTAGNERLHLLKKYRTGSLRRPMPDLERDHRVIKRQILPIRILLFVSLIDSSSLPVLILGSVLCCISWLNAGRAWYGFLHRIATALTSDGVALNSWFSMLGAEFQRPLTAMIFVYAIWLSMIATAHTVLLVILKDGSVVSFFVRAAFNARHRSSLLRNAVLMFFVCFPLIAGNIGFIFFGFSATVSTGVFTEESASNGSLVSLAGVYPFEADLGMATFITLLQVPNSFLWITPAGFVTVLYLMFASRLDALFTAIEKGKTRTWPSMMKVAPAHADAPPLRGGMKGSERGGRGGGAVRDVGTHHDLQCDYVEEQYELLVEDVKAVDAKLSKLLLAISVWDLPLLLFLLYRLILQSVDDVSELITVLFWLVASACHLGVPCLAASILFSKSVKLTQVFLFHHGRKDFLSAEGRQQEGEEEGEGESEQQRQLCAVKVCEAEAAVREGDSDITSSFLLNRSYLRRLYLVERLSKIPLAFTMGGIFPISFSLIFKVVSSVAAVFFILYQMQTTWPASNGSGG
mmetsp:Transcript_26659/g.68459  ORF Transcript_26659/g.68459 Transcript_26659/m.68459 type:complete len:671 (-) Transcript_26659:106-2118(-)